MIRRWKTNGSKVGRGAVMTGFVRGSGSLEVLGAYRGMLAWEGMFRVGPDAKVMAEGSVAQLEVCGELTGRLRATVEATVRGGGRWAGAGTTPSMTTEPGARLEGEFSVRPPDDAESKPAAG